MAKKRQIPRRNSSVDSGSPPGTAASAAIASAAPASSLTGGRGTGLEGSGALPAEVTRDDRTVPVLATMALLAPVVGSPVQELMQDTLKGAVVALLTLVGAFAFFWRQRDRRDPLRWHFLLWFPLILFLYALGSMAWSHTYLAGVEAVRWFLAGLLFWLGLNTLSRERVGLLAWGIHLGAVGAGVWAALQFWFDLNLFAQGPNPGSTFVNRNFFAEFVACTIPFGALLLARARSMKQVGLLAVTNGFVLVALMMTGTRSALATMWFNVLILLPAAGWWLRGQLALGAWTPGRRLLAGGLLLATVGGLGAIPAGNPKLLAEQRGGHALERAFTRTGSIGLGDESLGFRFLFLRETAAMVRANPAAGVGAGAWEVAVPLTQDLKVGIENHGYAHNEFVQVLAEYGLAGVAALFVLLAGVLRAVWITATDRRVDAMAEAPIRVTALASLGTLAVTSAVGFPWHMASTLAMGALCLAVIAASDARLGVGPSRVGASVLVWRASYGQFMALVTLVGSLLAVYVSVQAAQAEWRLVRAARLGQLVSGSGDADHPKWNETKASMLSALREGVALAPNYRVLIQPPVEQLTRWRDWKNAAWGWEALSAARPYALLPMLGAARARAMSGEPAKAQAWIDKVRKTRPDSPAWMGIAVVMAAQARDDLRAVELATEALGKGLDDFAMLNAAFEAAWRASRHDAAQVFMEKRMDAYPSTRQAGLILLGNMFTTGTRQPQRALTYFKAAMAISAPAERASLLPRIPPVYWADLGFPNGAPGAGVR